MPFGRPTSYKLEYCQMLIDHMAEGMCFETFAAEVDVCIDTIKEWEKVYPDFSAAKKRGYPKSYSYWKKLGRSAANGGIKDFNATVWIFTMKNRFNWRDKKDFEINIEENDD